MKGYKAFHNDLTCRRFQYEIGKTYEMEESPEPCERGFHFCKTVAGCYHYYPNDDDTRICEIEALGEIKTDDNEKFCTNKIRIVTEVTEEYARKGNYDNSSSGYCNSGSRNSGNWNSGNCNSSNSNSGNFNSGYSNSGSRNSGSFNYGSWNSSNWNSGNGNSGDCNSGNKNSGEFNSGNYNSGKWNSGSYNSGEWNSGNRSTGVFNTSKAPTIKMFDKESDWTIGDWAKSQARLIMCACPYTYSDFIQKFDMSPEEIAEHPECETIGGYIKVFEATNEDRQKWWNELNEDDKAEVMSLPNFDKDKFKACTGIEV